MPDEIRVLAPNALLGYGFPLESLRAGLRERPHVIGADGGSTDPGAYYLGAGTSFTGREAVKRDLRHLLAGAREVDAPLIVGSCGGAGGEPHLAWVHEIVRELVAEAGVSTRVALIHAEQDASIVAAAQRAGKLSPLSGAPELDDQTVGQCARIVAQMGYEPINAALAGGAQVVLAGRACDVSVYAALPIARGADIALSIHAAKIIECGAYCATPGSATDSIIAKICDEHFVLKATNPARTVMAPSAAAHSLYEQQHPSRLVEPVGVVDVSGARFREQADGSLEVSGSRFTPAEHYTVKLEGARRVGFRAVSAAGIRDPFAADNLEGCLEGARARVEDAFGRPGEGTNYEIRPHVYGHKQNGSRKLVDADVCLVLDVIADTQEEASEICSLARSTLLHHDYPGRISVGGNLALLFSPHDVAWGPVYEFAIYHLWEIDDPLAPFPIEYVEL